MTSMRQHHDVANLPFHHTQYGISRRQRASCPAIESTYNKPSGRESDFLIISIDLLATRSRALSGACAVRYADMSFMDLAKPLEVEWQAREHAGNPRVDQ
jgi:hypothetical protein